MGVIDNMHISQVRTRRGPLFGYYLHREYEMFNPENSHPSNWGKVKSVRWEISKNEKMSDE